VALAQDETDERWEPGVYMGQAMTAVFSGIERMTRDSDLGLVDGVSVFATFLPAGKAVELSTTLEEGKSYCIVGGGDEDCVDLDISVSGPEGEPVATDMLKDASPVVSFVAEASGMHTLRMELYEANVPSFCAMAILAEDGWTCPPESMDQALTRFVHTCEGMSKERTLSFHDEPNQWCLYCGIIESGSALRMSTITLEEGSHTFVAAGDDDMRDLDLYLLDGNDATLASDDRVDDVPIVTHQGATASDYQLRAVNADSAQPSFVVFAILDEG